MKIQALRYMDFVNIDCERMKTFHFLGVFTDICMIILCLLWGTQHFTIYLIDHSDRNQQGNLGLEPYFRPNGPNRHI